MVVYADILFLLNLVLDYGILLATARLTGRSFTRFRLLLGALVGAGYALLIFVKPFHFLSAIPLRILCGCLMTAVAFGGNGVWLRSLLVFWSISFLLGGGVIALATMGGASLREGIASTGLDFLAVLLAGSLVCCLIGKCFSKVAASPGTTPLVDVELELCGRKTAFRGFVDTGNTLTDSANHPVIVVDWQIVRCVLPNLTYRMAEHPPLAYEPLTNALGTGRVKLLPLRTVSGGGSLILVIRPDKVRLNGIMRDDLLVGISPHRVSENGMYHALVGVGE